MEGSLSPFPLTYANCMAYHVRTSAGKDSGLQGSSLPFQTSGKVNKSAVQKQSRQRLGFILSKAPYSRIELPQRLGEFAARATDNSCIDRIQEQLTLNLRGVIKVAQLYAIPCTGLDIRSESGPETDP